MRLKSSFVVGLFLAILLAGAWVLRPWGPAEQPRLLVLCAAGIRAPIEAAARAYQEKTGVQIDLQYGGSGTLMANLKISGQGDVYIPADRFYLERAVAAGLVAEGLPLASMELVAFVRSENPKNISTLEDLLRADVRVALGNPDMAATGLLARRVATELGIWEPMRRNIERHGVFKPTAPEVVNDVVIGTVDVALAWDAMHSSYPQLAMVRFPDFAPHRQFIEAGITKATDQPVEALRFARFLQSEEGAALFRQFGYDPARSESWRKTPELTFFCGAVNRSAVAPVIEAFEQREGVRINAVFNGCGILTGQMRATRELLPGAPASGFPDIYMACDLFYLENVKNWFTEGAIISEAAIVIAVPKGNPANIQTLADLARPGVRLTVGQPEQCTIGVLTRFILKEAGLYETILPNVVMQTASSAMLIPSVATGSADATIAYITDTQAARDRVDYIEIPLPSAKAVQPFAVALDTPYPHLSRRFLDHLLDARDAFTKAGFTFLADGQATD